MYESILEFNKEFEFEPAVVNAEKLTGKKKFIVAGMGGSNLGSGLVKTLVPELDLLIHRDYELPAVVYSSPKDYLVIVSSYSGNTEEAISAYEKAKGDGIEFAIVAAGGKLLEYAKNDGIPYVELPKSKIQPRMEIAQSLLAILALIGRDDIITSLRPLSAGLDPTAWEKKGQDTALLIAGSVPVIYASDRNMEIAYNWKIKFNETGKIPAFYNVLPELNHNEMTGFDVKEMTKDLSKVFHFIILHDDSDDPRIIKRMEVLEKLYKDRFLPVSVFDMSGATRGERIFNSLILADWCAYYTAQNYEVEAEQVPMVEEFKKLIKG